MIPFIVSLVVILFEVTLTHIHSLHAIELTNVVDWCSVPCASDHDRGDDREVGG